MTVFAYFFPWGKSTFLPWNMAPYQVRQSDVTLPWQHCLGEVALTTHFLRKRVRCHRSLVQNRKKTQKKHLSDNPLSHEQESERSERANERMSTAVRTSKACKQANEWGVWANELTDERVALYFHLYSWLFRTIVHREKEKYVTKKERKKKKGDRRKKEIKREGKKQRKKKRKKERKQKWKKERNSDKGIKGKKKNKRAGRKKNKKAGKERRKELG